MGHEVEFVRGVDRAIRADLIVPHVDLTVLPPEYVEFLKSHDNVVNRQVVDISKRSFSRLRVTRGDAWGGPVIVKSNLNYGGTPERDLLGPAWWERGLFRKLLRAAARRDRRTRFHPFLPVRPDRYPVFDSVADLPRGTFLNPRLHVERFRPERDGDMYCLRSYLFAGSAEVNIRYTCPNPVVKAAGIVDRKDVPVPEELREFRARNGFDYGKFDHVIVDGHVHLLDINRTPSLVALPEYSERQMGYARSFARALLEQFGLASPA